MTCILLAEQEAYNFQTQSEEATIFSLSYSRISTRMLKRNNQLAAGELPIQYTEAVSPLSRACNNGFPSQPQRNTCNKLMRRLIRKEEEATKRKINTRPRQGTGL